MRSEVRTPAAAQPGGAYSQGIVAGGFLFVSGQGPFDANGALVGQSLADQARATFANIRTIAEAAGGRLEDAVRIDAYLSDMDDFPVWDAVCAETFAKPYPTRTTVGSPLVGYDVEINAIIWLGNDLQKNGPQ